MTMNSYITVLVYLTTLYQLYYYASSSGRMNDGL